MERFWDRGRYFVVTISALCALLLMVIAYVFYSVTEIKNVSSEPYVTIINNNISAKTKLLFVKSEVLSFAALQDEKSLSKLRFKSRIYKSSILQDLLAERTNRVHAQFGNLNELQQVVVDIRSVFDSIDKLSLTNVDAIDTVITRIDGTYSRLNVYLADFVAEVQRQQIEFLDFKESFYNKQYVYLGIILLCSMLMISVISWMYLHQIRLGKDLEERTKVMEEAKRNAEQSSIAKARFLANMSHEMRTPLNAIIGLSQKEYYQSSDEQTRHFLSMINSSGEHLLKLINNVLDLSKIEQGKSKLESDEFFISELIDVSKTVFINFDKQQGVDVFFSVSLDRNYKIKSDKTKLVQIINNLGYNALKFTESGHVEIQISLSSESGIFNIVVRDTGIGMTQEQLDKVFQEFTQADDSITRKYGGTGLGLSICQSLVNLLGGSISVESSLGEGSEFSIEVPVSIIDSVPLVDDKQATRAVRVLSDNHYATELITKGLNKLGLHDAHGDAVLCYLSNDDVLESMLKQAHCGDDQTLIVYGNINTALPPSENMTLLSKPYDLFSLLDCLKALANTDSQQECTDDGAGISGVSVMLVEDIRMNQIVAQKMLATLEAEVTTVNNGQECVNLLSHEQFDIILMDIQMPIMDGLEALKQIKCDNLAPDTAIIALTANTFESDVQSYLEQGFDDVLPKPFKLEWLKEMLEQHV
ncbi:ATP-binding protein [Vibrio neptunius]|uniref:histidine kinase n=1 Tax=Vibrio neptunius TaxID=170651 RepID=A0ABS3A3P6_9VIBR|nr:ATP-binding protein [Vibrio neptunius]MBN3492863.1 response regulator [Vibrio neptunius]MBN3515419.1 response regulator [Vibrio neptunius]MBN3549395.1 response regulator [Vibrio neptunius]MBN3577664.1 response regulator [Vibrio neptunius]MCH9871328.1 response regulator [Vibrio neptunius]